MFPITHQYVRGPIVRELKQFNNCSLCAEEKTTEKLYNYGVNYGGFSEPRIQTVIAVLLLKQEDGSLAKREKDS